MSMPSTERSRTRAPTRLGPGERHHRQRHRRHPEQGEPPAEHGAEPGAAGGEHPRHRVAQRRHAVPGGPHRPGAHQRDEQEEPERLRVLPDERRHPGAASAPVPGGVGGPGRGRGRVASTSSRAKASAPAQAGTGTSPRAYRATSHWSTKRCSPGSSTPGSARRSTSRSSSPLVHSSASNPNRSPRYPRSSPFSRKWNSRCSPRWGSPSASSASSAARVRSSSDGGGAAGASRRGLPSQARRANQASVATAASPSEPPEQPPAADRHVLVGLDVLELGAELVGVLAAGCSSPRCPGRRCGPPRRPAAPPRRR